MNKKILIACEESQVVTQAFRDLGYTAYSCDILPTSGNRPDWHLQCDVLDLVGEAYDLVIAFPPCTALTSAGARWFKDKRANGTQQAGINFFLRMFDFNSPRICVENPIGIMSSKYRKPDQIVQPWMFGDNYNKSTCLWLKGLPKLVPTQVRLVTGNKVFKSGRKMSEWYYMTSCLPHKDRAKARSKTPIGLAKAMALQWGKLL